MNVITSVASAGEGAGYPEASSFSAAVDAIASVVKDASAAVRTVNLSCWYVGSFGLTDIIDSFEAEIVSEAGGDVKIEVATVQDTVVTLIEAKCGQVDELTSC